MRTLLLTLVCLGLATHANANPVAVKAAERDVERALAALEERFEEPVGHVATTDLPKLGLKKGDVVRTINGSSPKMTSDVSTLMMSPTELNLQVLRAGKTVYVRVAIQKAAHVWSIQRERFKTILEKSANHWLAGERDLRAVTNGNKPSGVWLGLDMTWLELGLGHNLIVRKIDGKAIVTPADFVAELNVKSVQSKIVFDVERADQKFTATLLLEDNQRGHGGKSASTAPSHSGGPSASTQASVAPVEPPPNVELNEEETKLIARIKKVNDTTYEIPVAVRDGVLANPTSFAKGARVVPAVKNGKPDGFKMYAIRPSSIYAALGLTSGDTIQVFNGTALTTADAALEAYTKLRELKRVTLDITRRGKPMTLTYTFK
jgi:hypothetical protein